jgi:probable HAF family extracellular repeat protein
MNADGSVVVGQSHDMLNFEQAFRWTAKNGMAGLGFLPGGNLSTATGGERRREGRDRWQQCTQQ